MMKEWPAVCNKWLAGSDFKALKFRSVRPEKLFMYIAK